MALQLSSYEKKLWSDDPQGKMDSLKHLQSGTAAELDAMLLSVLDKAFAKVLGGEL